METTLWPEFEDVFKEPFRGQLQTVIEINPNSEQVGMYTRINSWYKDKWKAYPTVPEKIVEI